MLLLHDTNALRAFTELGGCQEWLGKERMKTISILGSGYVGAVTAACFASRGHRVIGVDPNSLKTRRINEGLSPILERGVEEMLTTAKRNGLISATADSSA